MKSAVIGHPISHSKSPLIHQYWMKCHGVEGSYEALDIVPGNLSDRILQMVDAGYDGFNVTIPHKQSIMALCDDVDKTAQKIGAVNTVTIKDKKLFGTNTDAFGFIENIKTYVPDFNFTGKNILVLGAGGAARAVLYGLIDQGVHSIKISNRSQDKAEALKMFAPDIIEIVPWDEKDKGLSAIDLLVNTTSLGMTGKAALPFDLSALPTAALVHDIVYAPLMTDLLNQAQMRGNPIVTGIGMLLHQARPAFECWSGILPDVTDELQQDVLK